ncbi:MAG TPA: endonuclease/exonuclease/phosphatase family protein, partial [Halanaerobiales bacterium]|nr:endonuclease/exonuclease/phosphatase family protein [Halanaerobiales bacterium]
MRQKTILYGLLAILLIIFIFSGLLYIDERKDDPVISTSIKVPETPSELTIITYNINHGVDRSGKCNMDRIASLINEKGADIVGLNEVDKRMLRTVFKDQAKIISEKTGMNYVFAPNLERFTGTYGNALLSRFPILKAENHKLPQIKNYEARGLLDTTLLLPNNQQLRVLVTHLSVKSQERILQLAWLKNYLQKIEEPFFLLGDFNHQIETLLEMEPL